MPTQGAAGAAVQRHAIGRSSKFRAEVMAALVGGVTSGDAVGGSGETPLQLFARIGTDGRPVC